MLHLIDGGGDGDGYGDGDLVKNSHIFDGRHGFHLKREQNGKNTRRGC